ncbi:hypothetical protein M8J76_007657 [Diaphorina citri]|nr:hypothetical protein M8J76_007657 [Diaphorina citri]
MKYHSLYYLKRGALQNWGKKRSNTSTLVFILFLFTLLNIGVFNFFRASCPPATISIKYIEDQLRTPNFVSLLFDAGENTTESFPHPDGSARSSTFNMNVQLGRYDNQRLYRIFDNVFVGDRYIHLSNRYNICLATQSSIDKLDSLSEVAQHWSGPISLAVYVADDDEFSLLQGFVMFLQRCYDSITSQVALHILVPKSLFLSPTSASINAPYNTDDYPCVVKPDKLIKELLKKHHRPKHHHLLRENWKVKTAYPQNHLRNLARKNCQTYYNYLTDIDIIPSYNILDELDIFFKKSGQDKCRKCVYVIPTFELDHRVKYPKSKSDLLRLCRKKLAQPFHHRIFIYNQYATNFSRWENTTNDDRIHISHEVTNFEFLYEPFYISVDTVPPHDERFIGYGYTRNSQVYEMFIAGYTFKVLSPVFNCHWGLLTKKQRPPWREVQNNYNRLLMDDFKREVFAKYKYIPPAALATGTADVSSTKVAFSNGATGHKNTPKP